MSNHPTSPPPGSVPGSFSPGDMDALSEQLASQQGQSQTSSNSPVPGSPQSHAQKDPRSIGSLPQEAKYLTQDVGQGILQLLPDFMQQILGIKDSDTPEEKAKKKQMLHNYEKLNAEDQAYVQKKMQEEQLKKQQEAQEEEEKRQREAAMQSSDLDIPSGKVTGEAAAGASNKQRTTQKLQSDRKKLSNAG